MKKTAKQKMVPYLFLAPFLIIFLVFMVYPVLYSVVISFMRYKGGAFEFNGLNNFKMLFSDKLFFKSMANTFIILLIEVPIQTLLALVFAHLLNTDHLKCRGILRMAIFVPVLIDTVSYAIVFSLLFSSDGLVNSLLTAIGLKAVPWFTNSIAAKVLIMIAMIWRWTGYNTVIILGGMQNIPNELYEAASIDGASRFQQFLHVTLPGVRQVTLFSVVLSITGAMQLFTEPQLLTQGGPVNETLTIVQYIYQTGFKQFNFGVASAGAYILAGFIAVLTYVQMKLSKED